MGMNIYLYEVCDKGEKDCEYELIVDGNYDPVPYPEWIAEHIEIKNTELISYQKIAKEYGFSISDIVGERWVGNTVEIELKNGKKIIITDEEIDEKYTEILPLPTVKVKKIGYEGYGYLTDNFKEGKHPFFNYEEMVHILPIFIWKPEDMDRLNHIFKDPSRWKRIRKRFKKEKEAGKLVFVYLSW